MLGKSVVEKAFWPDMTNANYRNIVLFGVCYLQVKNCLHLDVSQEFARF
jgi:hypothetical protein